MADEELIVTLRNEEFVRKLIEIQKIIQDTKKEMKDLFDENKKGFSDIDKLNAYTKKMDELKGKLTTVTEEEKKLVDSQKDLKDAMKDTTEATDDAGISLGEFTKKAGLVAAAIALITKAAKAVIDAFKETTAGLDIMTEAGEAWRQVARDIVAGNFNLTQSLQKAQIIADKANAQRKFEREELIKTATLRKEYYKLYFEGTDRLNLTDKERAKILNEALAKHAELIEHEKMVLQGEIDVAQIRWELNKKDEVALIALDKLKAAMVDLEAKEYSETRRLRTQALNAEKADKEANMKIYLDWIEDRNKAYDKSVKAWEDWWKEWNKIEQEAIDKAIEIEKKLKDTAFSILIKDLPIGASIEMQRQEALDELEKLKNEIIKNIGGLTPAQEKYFDIAAKNINDTFQKALEENINPDILGTYLENTLGKGLQKVKIPQKGEEEEFSFWKIFGLDPESDEDSKLISSIQDTADNIMGIIDNVYSHRLEIARRETDLLTQMIDETEQEIELEAQLYEQGFANNLTARREYLAELKAQREKALEEEYKAARREQQFEMLVQTMNLITAASEIIKQAIKMTKNPIAGLLIGAGLVASMYLLFSKVKSQAYGVTGGAEFAEGGSGTKTGIITGKRHSDGGERFLDHVEVERGEAWGVLSRGASEKYGKVFHDMVSSFNKDEMPQFITPAISNSVRVENSGPNSRLDKVIKEQQKLNKTITEIPQFYKDGNKRIIRNGNKVRIIG